MKRVVIIGAGISGLAIAAELISRAGDRVDVRVIEAASRAGGNIRTEIDGGYVCEWGPEGFLDNTPETLDLARRAGLEDLLVRADPQSNKRFIVREGRLRLVPVKPPAFLKSDLLPLGPRLRVLMEPLVPAKRGDADESVFDFAARRIGPGAATFLVDAMVSGVFAGDARQLSLQSAFPRMHEMERKYGGLVKAMLARQKESRRTGVKIGGPSGPRGVLTTFEGGMEAFIHSLARTIGPQRLLLNMPVERIVPEAGGWLLKTAEGAEIRADVVVDTTPAPVAASHVRDFDPDLSLQLEKIPFASIAVAGLGYRRQDIAHPLDGFGFLVPRAEGRHLLGTLFTSSTFPNRAPHGHVLLRAMIGGATNPEAVEWSEAQLLRVCREEIHPLLGVSGDPVWHRIFRYRRGIAQYNIGHREILGSIRQHLAAHRGLYLAGTSYKGIAVNSACQEAAKLAREIAP